MSGGIKVNMNGTDIKRKGDIRNKKICSRIWLKLDK